MARERNHHFDNIKALLIFLVVLGHVISKFGGNTAITDIYKIIFSFHMPAFIFVSGYFAKYNPKKVFSKLLPLYLIFQMIQYFGTGAFSWIDKGVWQPAEQFQFFKPAWTLWYLVAMMVFQLMIPLFDTKDPKKRIGFLIVAFLLGMAVGLNENINNFLAMSRVFVFLPYFMAGYYEKDGQVLIGLKRRHTVPCKIAAVIMAVIAIIIFAIMGPSMNARTFFGTDSYTDMMSFVGRLLAWVIAFVWIFILIMLIPEKKVPLMGTIGSNTLPVYLLHGPVLIILVQTALKGVVSNNIVAMLILSAIITICLSWSGFEKALRKIAIPMGDKK